MRAGRICAIGVMALAFGLKILGTGCTINLTAPASGDGGNGGATTGDSPDTTGGDPGATTNEPNPNSPCPDQTNVSVSYVNESSAVLTCVEAFKDRSNQRISGRMVLLLPAGDPQARWEHCIACPWQAGIRNIDFFEDNIHTKLSPPADLFQGAFKCGDRITFTFKADQSIHTAVETP